MSEKHTRIPLPKEDVLDLCNELMSPQTTPERVGGIAGLVGLQDQEAGEIDISHYPDSLLAAFMVNRYILGGVKDKIAHQVLERRDGTKNTLYQGQ